MSSIISQQTFVLYFFFEITHYMVNTSQLWAGSSCLSRQPLHDVFKIMLACRIDVQWDRTKKERPRMPTNSIERLNCMGGYRFQSLLFIWLIACYAQYINKIMYLHTVFFFYFLLFFFKLKLIDILLIGIACKTNHALLENNINYIMGLHLKA